MSRKKNYTKLSRSVKLAFAANRAALVERMAEQPESETPLAERLGKLLRQNRGSILLTKINPDDTETKAIEV